MVEEDLLCQLDKHESCIARLESRMQETRTDDEGVSILDTLPGVGAILATVIFCEVGEVHRFPSSGHLAAYPGLTPRIHSCGKKTRHVAPLHGISQRRHVACSKTEKRIENHSQLVHGQVSAFLS